MRYEVGLIRICAYHVLVLCLFLQCCVQEMLVRESAEYAEAEIATTVVQALMLGLDPGSLVRKKSEQ